MLGVATNNKLLMEIIQQLIIQAVDVMVQFQILHKFKNQIGSNFVCLFANQVANEFVLQTCIANTLPCNNAGTFRMR